MFCTRTDAYGDGDRAGRVVPYAAPGNAATRHAGSCPDRNAHFSTHGNPDVS